MATGLLDIPAIRTQCDTIRANHRAIRRTPPKIRLWTNNPDGSPGLILRGHADDTVAGKFPWKKNTPTTATLRLRLDHYLAKWLISIPDDPDAKKNVVITVDHMGDSMRWSGLLKSWSVTRGGDGLRYLDVTFVDDLQFLQFMLAPPNPLLPIPVFQFPRVLPIFGPAKWAVSMMILLNLIRLNGNLWTLPDDPFDLSQWGALFDWSSWQVLIKADPFDLDDSSVWALLATRMNRMDEVIGDALEDAQLVLTYRRILTVDGETCPVDGVDECANGALVLEVVDRSGYYSADGTSTGGGILGGLERTITSFASGFVEDVSTLVTDSSGVWPDAYYQPGFLGTLPGYPWVVVRDNPYTQIDTSVLTWSPPTAVSVIVGGDNPLMDQLASLIIEAVGSLVGYFLLGGFSALGAMANTVIMPFLQGTIAAWLQWKNNARAIDLGWVHLWEVFQAGAENNAWSLSSIAALRAGFEATKSETAHQFTMRDGGQFLPGLHFQIGDRIGSTDNAISNRIFVDQVEELTLAWDWASDAPHEWQVTVGKSKAAMSNAERQSRAIAKALSLATNIGTHLVS